MRRSGWKRNMINFTQINLHKASQATLLLGDKIKDTQQQVLLLSEPHTVAGKLVGLPKGTTAIYDKRIKENEPPPRAAIVTSNDITVAALEGWCSRDCAVAIARIRNRQVILMSVYLDIHMPVQPRWLLDLMTVLNKKKYPIIAGFDTNAHSTLYGPSNNARGDDFEDFILKEGFQVENLGQVPTFEIMRGNTLVQTHIDVTLTRNMNPPVQGWTVDRSYNGSDHNTVRFTIPMRQNTPEMVRPWSSADWGTFKLGLECANIQLPEYMTMKKLDQLVGRLYTAIEESLDKACPRKAPSRGIPGAQWITEKHEKRKAAVTKLYASAKSLKTPEAWQVYKKADREFKKMCKKDKNRSWRKYKESLQTEKDVALLVKIAQRKDARQINTMSKPDGSYTEPGAETIKSLTEAHFPAATSTKHVTYNNRKRCKTSIIQTKYSNWINERLVRDALQGFEKKKSPGPDGLRPLLFDHLPHNIIALLTTLYKAAIHLAYTPKEWKRTKVIFIAKPGKEAYDIPKSFRPISLSNYFLKGLERLVGWKMDQALIANPLHHKQHCFLAGKSTESAISNTVNYIEKHIMSGQHCVGVFLDISSAFDSIQPGHVRSALLKHGGHADLVQWYYNYITHRDIEISMHGVLSAFSTGLGFPQGGVCSAKFWLIAFDYAIQIINRYCIEGNGYADDCSALFGGKRLDHCLRRLQKMLDDLTAWGRTCGLRFNPEKSVAILFTRTRKTPPFHLKIDGKDIKFQQEVRYLGVTLDSKLYWNKHIDEKIKTAKRFLTQVAIITRNNWGPKPKLMRWAYTAVVRPMLCYGAMIWGHEAQTRAKKLRRLNRMAMNTFANYPKSTPTTALEIALDIAPIPLFCQQEALATVTRLQDIISLDWEGTYNRKTHAISHLKHWATKINEHNIQISNPDRCNRPLGLAEYKINRDSFDGKTKHRRHTQYNVYTDGSRLDDQTGLGLTKSPRPHTDCRTMQRSSKRKSRPSNGPRWH